MLPLRLQLLLQLANRLLRPALLHQQVEGGVVALRSSWPGLEAELGRRKVAQPSTTPSAIYASSQPT